MKNTLITVLLYLIYINSHAQNYIFSPENNIPISISGVSVQNPFTGGINVAQLYKIQLDGIGNEDLVVFDKFVGRVLTYLSVGNMYIYAPKYEYLFPKIAYWLTIIDYDQDGKKDIFTSSSLFYNYVEVYRNISTTNSLTGFSSVSNSLFSNNRGISREIYCSFSDSPAVLDIDNDGDIDIVAYDGLGSLTLNLYKNNSIETTSVPGLVFEKYSSCWGKINIGFNCNNLTTTLTNCANFGGTTDARVQHNGSSVAISDLNGDGLKDLLLGDTGCPSIYFHIGTGTNLDSRMQYVTQNYPASYPITVSSQPLISLIDIDNDSKEDMIVSDFNSPYSSSIDYSKSLQYFNNISNTSNADFNFHSNDYFQSSTLDFGIDSAPELADVDADGDLDMIIGTRVSNLTAQMASIKLFENIGNSNAPQFNLINQDYLNLSSILGSDFIKPRFADINYDGAKDLYFLSRASSNLVSIKYILNQSNSSQAFSFNSNDILTLNLGISLTENDLPFLVDINGDQLQDVLLSRGGSGLVNYFRNKGTASSPSFVREINLLGGLDFDINRFNNSVIVGKITSNSSPALLWVDNRGKIYVYSNFINELNNFQTLDSIQMNNQPDFTNINIGARTYMTLADLNLDGNSDLILGSQGGGIRYFQNIFSNSTTPLLKYNKKLKSSIELFPNPAKEMFFWNDIDQNDKEIKIYNYQGQLKYSKSLAKEITHEIEVSKLEKGIYIVQIYTSEGIFYNKIEIFK